jgi:hypothetical protein
LKIAKVIVVDIRIADEHRYPRHAGGPPFEQNARIRCSVQWPFRQFSVIPSGI